MRTSIGLGSTVLLLAVASCASPPKRADGSALFIELRSAHFVLTTDVAEPDARAYLSALEDMRAALLEGSWHAPQPPEGAVQVTLLADRAEFREFARDVFDGFFATDVFGERLMVFNGEQSPSQLRTLKHELAHYLNGFFLLRQPRWLSEGLACYLETIRTDEGDGRVVIGEPDSDRVRHVLRFPILDYASVLQMGAELHALPAGQVADFYAASWLLVHYLADVQRPRLNQYIGRLARAEDPRTAWQAVFPDLTPDVLAQQTHAYLARGKFGTGRIPAPRFKGEVAVRQLPPAEQHALRAQLLFISLGNAHDAAWRARVVAEVAAALRAEPGNPLATGVRLALGGPEAEDKLGLAKAVVAARPDDFRGYALLASALREGKGDVAAERAALEKAAQLAPANASMLNALAWHDAAHGRAAEALPLARRAVQLLPGNPAHLDTFAVALAQAGQCDDALKVEQRAIEILPDGAPAEAAATLRGRLDELPRLCKPPASQAASAQQDAPVTPPQRTNKCKSTGPLAPRTAKLKPGAAVDVEYVINASGGAEQVKGRPGSDPALVRAVSDYLKGCRFIPAKQGGASVPAAMVAHFTFDRVR